MQLSAFENGMFAQRLRVTVAALASFLGTGTAPAQPAPDAVDALTVRANQRVLIVDAGRRGGGGADNEARSIYIVGPDVEVQHITVNGPVLLLCGEIRVLEPRTTADPDPRTEAAVRRLSEEFARGAPNLDQMTPCMATSVRGQLDDLRERFTALGPIKAMTFDRRRSALGVLDAYDVEYTNGSLTWVIGLTSDGQTETWMFHDG